MRTKTLFLLLTIAITMWTSVITSAQQQKQATLSTNTTSSVPSDSTSILRPSEELLKRLEKNESRKRLLDDVLRMVKQRIVDAEALEEARKQSNGSPRDIAISNLLAIEMLLHTAEAVGPVSALGEHYRHDVYQELKQSALLYSKRQRDLQIKSKEIAELADEIVRGTDAEGKALPAVQLQAKEKLLYELKKHRIQMEVHRDQYRQDLEFCKNELGNIRSLEQFLEGEIPVLESSIHRYLDAVEHGKRTIAAKDLKESGEALRMAVDSLKGPWNSPPPPERPGTSPLGPGIGSLQSPLKTSQALTKGQKDFIRPELEEARRRLKHR